jgi:ATP-dependent Clp protease ATP-binding subunit ClpC
MFERFTDRARHVVVLAQEEARDLRHGYIGTEHLLLGLLREEDGPAAQALGDCGVTFDQARDVVVGAVGLGEQDGGGQVPFTPKAKRALERSLREALRLEDGFIGTEHILLGVLREEEGMGYEAIVEVGAEPEAVRSRVLDLRGARAERRRGRRPKLGSDAQALLTRARDLAESEGRGEVTLDDLRTALEASG